MKAIIFSFFIAVFVSGCGADLKNTAAQKKSAPASLLVTYTGVDMNGDAKSCAPMAAETMCTMMYGPEDQFADDCRAQAGKKAIACGCHSYICVSQ